MSCQFLDLNSVAFSAQANLRPVTDRLSEINQEIQDKLQEHLNELQSTFVTLTQTPDGSPYPMSFNTNFPGLARAVEYVAKTKFNLCPDVKKHKSVDAFGPPSRNSNDPMVGLDQKKNRSFHIFSLIDHSTLCCSTAVEEIYLLTLRKIKMMKCYAWRANLN